MTDTIDCTGETEVTTDHDAIRTRIEERGATVAQVTDPAGDDPGSLTVVPEGRVDDAVRELPWDEFFEIFEDEGLAFVSRSGTEDDDRVDWGFVDRDESVGTDATRAESNVATEESPARTIPEGEPGTAQDALEEAEAVGSEPAEGRMGETGPTGEDMPEPESEPVSDEMAGSGGIETPTEESVADEMSGSEDVDLADGEGGGAMGPGEVDESEIVAGETTSRGESDEEGIDERTFGDTTDETRTESDVVTEEPVEGPSSEGEPSAPDETADAEPAEPLESTVETTDTIEREPLESDVDTGEPEPIETAAGEEGVDAEPIESQPVESEVEPADPGESASEGAIPTDREPPASEPAEPMEGELGGEPIESGSVTGERADPTDPTAEEEGKDVVDEAGERLGTVADVEREAIRVDPDPELSDNRRDELGWGDRRSGSYRIETDRLREITATEVVIRR